MTATEIRVRGLIADNLRIGDRSRVTDAAALRDDLGADDLDILDLSMVLEEAFGIELSDDDLSKMLTVGDAVKTINRMAGAAQ